MWNWFSRLTGASVIQDDWTVSRHPFGVEVVVKRRTYNCDEVIQIVREVTTLQSIRMKEGRITDDKASSRANCYIRNAD